MFLTLAIPTYEMKPSGNEFLDFSLEKLSKQIFKNFEIVISDHSDDDKVEIVVKKWSHIMDIIYLRKTVNIDNPSSNLNNIFKNSNGDYIKILFQDDFLFDDRSLQNTVDAIHSSNYPAWLVSYCEHTIDCINMIKPYIPRYNHRMHIGLNTISSPSVLTIKNNPEKIFFNENFKWLMDCVYYKDCYNKFGYPEIIKEITIVNRIWGNQLTNLLSEQEKENEVLKASFIYDFFVISLFRGMIIHSKRILKKIIVKIK